MKKFLALVFVTAVWFMNFVMGITFADQSFLKQNLTNAPKVPGLENWVSSYDVKTQAQSSIDNIIKMISGIINWVLGLLALISLIILIYTGVRMLLNSGDDKAVEAWYKTAKNVFIALLFIGASWIVVQAIFYVIKLFVV